MRVTVEISIEEHTSEEDAGVDTSKSYITLNDVRCFEALDGNKFGKIKFPDSLSQDSGKVTPQGDFSLYLVPELTIRRLQKSGLKLFE